MFRIYTPGRYLQRNGENMVLEDRPYNLEELEGCSSSHHKVLVKDLSDGSSTVIAPGQPIYTGNKNEDLTKAELLELMSDRVFPKKITKAKLLEAYYGG